MPNLNISVPHKLQSDVALQRVQSAIKQILTEHQGMIKNLTESWNGQVGEFSATVMGMSISVTLWVTGSEVNITGNYPLAGIIYKKRIESEIKSAAERILG